MKKILTFLILFALLIAFPATAYAQDVTPEPEEPIQEENIKTIEINGYLILVTPADDENPVTLGVFKIEDSTGGQEPEPIITFSLGGTLGESVSELAHVAPAGPDHGKIISSFVREVNFQRKEQKRLEKMENKNKELTDQDDVDDKGPKKPKKDKQNKGQGKKKHK